jgi:hypothetical protein|uniref:Uncharacterized protein n=1 Tax=Phaeodactylum tricornutum TaxID=2850 RepID=A0A8J9S3E5_PHATR
MLHTTVFNLATLLLVFLATTNSWTLSFTPNNRRFGTPSHHSTIETRFVLCATEDGNEPDDKTQSSKNEEGGGNVVQESEIPPPISEGPQEGYIPGKDNAKQGGYTMAKQAVKGSDNNQSQKSD